MYRHVAKTGDIKDFIVTEESGIAKGIRRVVAVTGHEAAEARRQGESLTAQLNRIETMPDAEKDVALKAYTVVSACFHSLSNPATDRALGVRSKSGRRTYRCSRRTSYGTASARCERRSTSTSRTRRPPRTKL